MHTLIVRLDFHCLFIKVKEGLKRIAILILIPDFHKPRCYLYQNLCILVAVCIIALPQIFLIQGFKPSSRLIHDKPLVYGDSLYLNAACAECHLRVLVQLLCLAEILIGLEIDFPS